MERGIRSACVTGMLRDGDRYSLRWGICNQAKSYVNFPHISNMLSKAAIFEKPIVVSEGHLIAARVREYRLGEVVPQGDDQAVLRAIRAITDDPAGWRERIRPRWAEHRERHSKSRLRSVLSELFSGPDIPRW